MNVERATWRAIGTTVTVATSAGSLRRAATSVERLLRAADDAYSRFRPDSEISRLSQFPGQWVPVSSLLLAAVGMALRAARLSDGLVDPTVGRAMRLIGYDDHFERVSRRTHGPASPPLRFEAVPGWQAVDVDARRSMLRLPVGIELDLGSTGKAFAADLAAAAALAAMGGGGVVVSLGGDIAIAGETPPGGWRIGLAEDASLGAKAETGQVTLGAGAIATSSTTIRRWTRSGVALHHILDPRTGRPADGCWRTATVAATTCVDANTAATAAIILGDAAPSWLARQGVAARLVDNQGAITTTPAWPTAEGVAA